MSAGSGPGANARNHSAPVRAGAASGVMAGKERHSGSKPRRRSSAGIPTGLSFVEVSVSFFRLAAWLAAGIVSMGCSSSRSGSADGGAPPCTRSTCAGTCTAGRCFVTLSTPSGQPYGAYDLVVGKTTVYWAESSGGGGYILSVPAAGGATATLASSSDYPVGLAVDTSHVFWASSAGSLDGGS